VDHLALILIAVCMAAGFVSSLWAWFEADRVHMRLYEIDLELAQSFHNPFLSEREGGDSRFGQLLKNELLRHPDAEVRRLALRVRRIKRATGVFVVVGVLVIFGMSARADWQGNPPSSQATPSVKS